MKIRFRSTGGFAGLNLGCDLDTEALPEPEATLLTRLVHNAKLKKTSTKKSDRGRDLVNYEITIKEPQGATTATFDDLSVPPEAEALLDFLRERAHPVALK